MILTSKTDKRIIVEAKVNDITINLLVDTGATVGIIDSNQYRMLGAVRGKSFKSTLMAASGEMDAWYCNTLFWVGDKQVGQFLIADIGAVVRSIARETGITISGILSLPQMAMLGATIDTGKKKLIINN